MDVSLSKMFDVEGEWEDVYISICVGSLAVFIFLFVTKMARRNCSDDTNVGSKITSNLGKKKTPSCRVCGKEKCREKARYPFTILRTDDYENIDTENNKYNNSKSRAEDPSAKGEDIDEMDERTVRKRYREHQRKYADSVSSFGGGASTCSGCSEVSTSSSTGGSIDSNGEVSISVMREWLKSQDDDDGGGGGDASGAMVSWMKREMRKKGKEAGIASLPPLLARDLAKALILKGPRLTVSMCGLEGRHCSSIASGYLWKRRRKTQRWRIDRFFSKNRDATATVEQASVHDSKVWQRRYFELAGETNCSKVSPFYLRYFSSRSACEDRPHRPRGVINLRQIDSVVVSTDGITLHLHLRSDDAASAGRNRDAEAAVWLLRAHRPDDAKLWADALKTRVVALDRTQKRTQKRTKRSVASASSSAASAAVVSPAFLSSSSKTSEDLKIPARRIDEERSRRLLWAKDRDEEQIELVRKKHCLDARQLSLLREMIRKLREADETRSNSSSSTADEIISETMSLGQIVGAVACDNNPYDTLPFICQRYLRGRKFDVHFAIETMRKNAQWRMEENISELMHGGLAVERILGCDPDVVFRRHPILISGHDRDGRVCVFKYMGKKTVFKAMMKQCPLDSLLRFHIHTTEHTMYAMGKQSRKLGRNMEKMRVVVDCSGFHMGLFGSAAVRFLSFVAKTDQSYYIERLHSVFVINAPWSLTFAWRVVAKWVDDATKEKVKIMGDEKEWAPILRQYIDDDQIPRYYGGSNKSVAAAAYAAALRAEPLS
eukprot:g3232.t1